MVGQWAGAQGGPKKEKNRGPPLVGQRAGAEGGPRTYDTLE